MAKAEQANDSHDLICQQIEAAARSNTLPVDFFTRLIWQESRFQPDVVGPVTRSGERAQGIAQFMPGTAMERQLFEPFDPVAALSKSGEFLAELRAQFGNLGLAAAAYNAGPERVREFVAGSRDLPAETRNYVLAITGRQVEDWTIPAVREATQEKYNAEASESTPPDCRKLLATLQRGRDPLAAAWQGRNVPSWCKGLHHPDVNVCGPVHLIESTVRMAGLAIPRSRVHLSR
jgi:hypothetical protein